MTKAVATWLAGLAASAAEPGFVHVPVAALSVPLVAGRDVPDLVVSALVATELVATGLVATGWEVLLGVACWPAVRCNGADSPFSA